MITFQIAGNTDTGYRLQERNYPAQGISPFYTTLCRLQNDEAAALHGTRLIRTIDGRPPEGNGLRSAGLLSLRDAAENRLEIWIELKAMKGRALPYTSAVPGFEAILKEAVEDSAKCAEFLANTGISDQRRETYSTAVPT